MLNIFLFNIVWKKHIKYSGQNRKALPKIFQAFTTWTYVLKTTAKDIRNFEQGNVYRLSAATGNKYTKIFYFHKAQERINQQQTPTKNNTAKQLLHQTLYNTKEAYAFNQMQTTRKNNLILKLYTRGHSLNFDPVIER